MRNEPKLPCFWFENAGPRAKRTQTKPRRGMYFRDDSGQKNAGRGFTAAGIARKWEGERREPNRAFTPESSPVRHRSFASLQGPVRPLRCCLTLLISNSLPGHANRNSRFHVVQ
jgi:hypothetical protein